ncbi:MAG: cobalt-precorrin-5B (C(1))-methyltransferase CbiD [Coriobacteriia bacterium]|nr:cobalt-precorrin-5B (C(1))-methyltransferase CbiD [Coriobacteriia bacterium]
MSKLRTGVTTGLSAAGAAKAAMIALLSPTAQTVDEVTVFSTYGQELTLAITETSFEGDWVKCGVVKDGGDDPDVTSGLTVYCAVAKSAGTGVELDGGEGIGRVTKPGLKVAVGQAAINPVPRAMISAAIAEVCELYAYTGGIKAVVSIPGGEEVAKKTLNARLGVIGGLSVLGTTGIVEPMSDQALLDTVKTELDVCMASGIERLLIMPGNYGRDFARDELGLDTSECIRCSNFIGETLEYAVEREVPKAVLIGHAGKLVKLAGGIMNTHSKYADCRMEIIAAHAALANAGPALIGQIFQCVTTEAAIDLLVAAGINEAVWQSIGKRIEFYLGEKTKHQLDLEFVVFTQEHGVLVEGALSRADKSGTGKGTAPRGKND